MSDRLDELSDALAAKRDLLVADLAELNSCLVAFSGGVDSAVAAKAAFLALREKAIAVTAESPSVAEGEIDQARAAAKVIGIEPRVIRTAEITNPDYRRNAPDRCYHCKSELFTKLGDLAREMNIAAVVAGANQDDAGDYRPGLKAAAENLVRNPLMDHGITKEEVRRLALHWGLPVWDKPATPCLSSRIAYGQEVTPDRLSRIDAAERFLRSREMSVVRVRFHEGDLARVEVPLDQMARFCEEPFRTDFVDLLKSLGFQFVTLDLQGFRSGSMNSNLPHAMLPILG
ncbi:MAG: ATP-dependent sacrificial sulfur transferase LarE [Planctomycetales bacterium]